MSSVCLYFKIHQPYRLKEYQANEIEINHSYEDGVADEVAVNQAADNCYIPANTILLSLIKKFSGAFKISFSISGTTLELLQRYRPDVIELFKQLTATGCVEILAETYYHSLSSLHSKKEFHRQVEMHTALVKETLNTTPAVFRNTELIHNNDLAIQVAGMGFKGMLCEGIERILQDRTVNRLYASPDNGDFGLLLRNVRLSDDIAFRFDDEQWNEYPLTAQKFAEWLGTHPADTEVINLFLDYETFGIHKKPGSGIFQFLEELPAAVLKNTSLCFKTPAEALEENYPKDMYDVSQTISWEDKSRENCVWTENVMQNNTLKKIYSIENMVMNSDDENLQHMWGRLQAADYFYYMADEQSKTDHWKYLNPYQSPKEAWQYYTNIITDLEITLIRNELKKGKKKSRSMAILY